MTNASYHFVVKCWLLLYNSFGIADYFLNYFTNVNLLTKL